MISLELSSVVYNYVPLKYKGESGKRVPGRFPYQIVTNIVKFKHN